MSLPPPIPLDQAQARLLAMAEPLGACEVAAEFAVGRYLAAPLVARRTQPAADLSAMDGYAVRADDLAGPWQVVGESAAGHPFAAGLQPGEAIRISTGALMPDGGGAVLLQEEAERDGAALGLLPGGAATPSHIRRAGFDFREGSEVLASGQPIGPAQLAVAISAGHATLPVGRLPTVAIIDSGDELASDPSSVGAHQIPASNGAMLAALAAPLAERVTRIGPVRDTLGDLLASFEEAASCDVLVTSGGASVGDHDLVRPALEQWGAQIDFWRIAIKPGKPLLVARRGQQFILGLPGNPVSSYVTAFLFLLPLLRRLGGATSPLPDLLQMKLGAPLPATGNRLEFVRAVCAGGEVIPVREQDSSALAALAGANALIRREIGAPAAARGDAAGVYLLRNGGIA